MAAKTDAEFEAMNRDQSAFQLDLYKDALDRLDIIQQNATRLTDLTNQLLELSKLFKVS